MATHGFRSREYHSAGPGERKRQERGRGYSYGAGLVWLRVIDYCDDWAAGYDTEYPGTARYVGLMRWTERKGIISFFFVFILIQSVAWKK